MKLDSRRNDRLYGIRDVLPLNNLPFGNYLCIIYTSKVEVKDIIDTLARSVEHVTMSSKNRFGPVKMYSLLDQLTSRNLSSSYVEYANVL
jgi:hypothetical protein